MTDAHRSQPLLGSAVPLLVLALSSCTSPAHPPSEIGMRVRVTRVNGAALPTAAVPLAANLGDVTETWEFTAEALDAAGGVDTSFAGTARVSVEPGSVLSVEGPDGHHRNVEFKAGVATGIANVTAMFGEARLWVEDLGYVPADPGQTPVCSNGLDDDGDVVVDYPVDPGCAFADDMTEEPGTGRAGVSPPVHYEKPRVSDVQGRGSSTPYPSVAVEVKTDDPSYVVVTRVASTGFFATDITDLGGFNHIYAFNFNTPYNMRVCDRLTLLSGTASEFFGFTELSFPSYEIEAVYKPEDCLVPDPVVVDAATVADPVAMEMLESGLVRIEGFQIAANFGPGPAVSNAFGPDSSNCDLNGDGVVDYLNDAEGSCSNACSAAPECSEWTGYIARGNYKVHLGATMMQVNTDSAGGFDPKSHRGEVLTAVTGTLRNFSGGSLNWTVEARCLQDLVCARPECSATTTPANVACVSLRTQLDNEAGTN